MKKNFRFLALSAAILSMFTACQREELNQNQNPEGLTHTVTFLAGDAGTKTIVDISDGKTAKFSFTEGDIDRITIWENGVKGTVDKKNSSVENGIMTITATFAGEETEENKTYTAVLNTSSISTQIVSSNSYDEDADVLVAKPVTTAASGIKFQFKREVAIAKMTLKGLDAGENINYVSISSSSEAGFAGSFDGKEWISTASSIDIASQAYMEEGEYIITANASGEAEVWFTCIPQTDATLTVTVESADGDTYTKEFRNPITLTRGDVKGFGVAMKKDAKGLTFDFVNHPSGWKTSSSSTNNVGTYYYSLNGTDFSFTSDGDIYCGGASATSGYLMIKSGCHLGLPSLSGYRLAKVIGTLNDSGTPSTKSSVSITDSDSKTVEGGDAQIWNSKGASFTYTLLNTDENAVYYLSPTSANLQVIKLVLTYEPAKARTVLTAPTNLAVSADKVVSWDAVDGAASYDLTIGSAKFTCETNSYNASEIADEYYDVAVVAVPSDTENYKNSDAATLTDAKFGTPTLPKPTLKEGAVDEFSVNATWTVDSRATKGYNCELFNGETKVGESKIVTTGSVTFGSLNDGVTYTLKVNAIAVDGTKAYAASPVASIELTTKGTVTLSQITEAGTYTVKNVTVYAVIGTSTAVIGDGTAYFYLYKSNHGLQVGNTFTVGGTVKAYNGVWEFDSPTISNKETGSTPTYENAVEADEAYLTSYASAPSTEYIHAKGTQSGRTITVGSQALYLSAANDATDGKDVEVYGFVYGYNSSHSNISFYAISITEDPTAPKLTVTPTSKTWASDGVDAATFTVTTNTEGKKDWTVSPETLDWATIVVNKDEGKITVTPNDANTTKTARKATLTVTHSAGTLSETIDLIQSAAGEKTVEKTSGLNASKTLTSMDSYISYVNSASNTYSDPMRIYQGNTFTISASGAVITKVEFTCDTSQSTGKPITGLTEGTVIVDSGATSEQSANGDVVTYTISESTTSFAVTASAQFRVSGIKVTYKTN